MIEPKTETVELFSRLGKVGSVQAFDPWESRKSVAHAKAWVARVASISYGNTEAANPEHLFQKIVERGHLSCLEFVPVLMEDEHSQWECGSLPYQSLRTRPTVLGNPSYWGDGKELARELRELVGDPDFQASAFLVTCPLYTRSQWMRHRSFSYLEMSRRYTKGSKVAWEFYGSEDPLLHEEQQDAVRKYERRLAAGMPPEIARGCMPMEAMTTFWVAGFDRDWRAFLKLRDDDHAQPEIRAFASWIRDYLGSKESNA